jgi:hypothetical protein
LVLLTTLSTPLVVAINFQWFQALPNLGLQSPSLVYMFLTFSAAGYAQVYRYRHVSSPRERQQTKWAVAGLVLAVVLIRVELVLFTILARWPPHAALPWWTDVFGLIHTLEVNVVPLTLTVAVLHYRVFDIDLLIRRTLVYGSLTAILRAVYVAGVLGTQAVVRALTSQTGQQPVFIVASTLLVAALFSPRAPPAPDEHRRALLPAQICGGADASNLRRDAEPRDGPGPDQRAAGGRRAGDDAAGARLALAAASAHHIVQRTSSPGRADGGLDCEEGRCRRCGASIKQGRQPCQAYRQVACCALPARQRTSARTSRSSGIVSLVLCYAREGVWEGTGDGVGHLLPRRL